MPERSTAPTASISSLPIMGLAIGMKSRIKSPLKPSLSASNHGMLTLRLEKPYRGEYSSKWHQLLKI
jgi:hypothetical protein